MADKNKPAEQKNVQKEAMNIPEMLAKLKQDLQQKVEKKEATPDDLKKITDYEERVRKGEALKKEEEQDVIDRYKRMAELEKEFGASDNPTEETEEKKEEDFRARLQKAKGVDKLVIIMEKIGEMMEKVSDMLAGMGSGALLKMAELMEKMNMDPKWISYLRDIAGSEKAVLQGILKERGANLKKDKLTDKSALNNLKEMHKQFWNRDDYRKAIADSKTRILQAKTPNVPVEPFTPESITEAELKTHPKLRFEVFAERNITPYITAKALAEKPKVDGVTQITLKEIIKLSENKDFVAADPVVITPAPAVGAPAPAAAPVKPTAPAAPGAAPANGAPAPSASPAPQSFT